MEDRKIRFSIALFHALFLHKKPAEGISFRREWVGIAYFMVKEVMV